MDEKTLELARSALLTALALGLSYMERFIPIGLVVPMPVVKLGLANVVTLIALYRLGTRPATAILFTRCVLGSLFGGGVTALAFSLTGGFLALAAMVWARRLQALSVYGVSMLGAAAHNVGQICAAMVLMRSRYVVGYLPFLLAISVVCGLATGALSAGVLRLLPAAPQHTPKREEGHYVGASGGNRAGDPHPPV